MFCYPPDAAKNSLLASIERMPDRPSPELMVLLKDLDTVARLIDLRSK